MPARRTPNWISLVAIAGLVALAALMIHGVIANSANPGSYYGYRHHPEDFVYPADDVLTWTLAIAVETLAACTLLLLVRGAPVATCAAIAAIFAVITSFFMLFAMHAPPYYGGHLVFALFSAAWLGLIVIVAGIVRLVVRLHRGPRRDRDAGGGAAPSTDR